MSSAGQAGGHSRPTTSRGCGFSQGRLQLGSGRHASLGFGSGGGCREQLAWFTRSLVSLARAFPAVGLARGGQA